MPSANQLTTLDAALATHGGPDELEVRVELAGKLADVAAHLGDAEARLTAHLWLLTVAAERGPTVASSTSTSARRAPRSGGVRRRSVLVLRTPRLRAHTGRSPRRRAR